MNRALRLSLLCGLALAGSVTLVAAADAQARRDAQPARPTTGA